MSLFRRKIIMMQKERCKEWEGHIDNNTFRLGSNAAKGTRPTNLTDDIIAQFPYILYTSEAYYPRWLCSTEPIFYTQGSWGSFYPVVNIECTYVSNKLDTDKFEIEKLTDSSIGMQCFTTQLTEHYYKNKNVYWNTSYLQIGKVPMYLWNT